MRHKFGIKEVDECHISSVITGYNEADRFDRLSFTFEGLTLEASASLSNRKVATKG